jgi:Lhr-like helicase
MYLQETSPAPEVYVEDFGTIHPLATLTAVDQPTIHIGFLRDGFVLAKQQGDKFVLGRESDYEIPEVVDVIVWLEAGDNLPI